MVVYEHSVVSKACCMGGYDSEVCFEICFGGMIRGMIRPTFFIVYINTISYIILHQAGDWGCFLKGPTGPWHSKARFGYDSGYDSGRRLFVFAKIAKIK